MTKTIFTIIFTVLALNSINALAQQPKTVTDYFLAMPNDKYATDINGNAFKNKAALIKFRRSLIKIEDTKNGYLKLEGAWEGWAEIALFKKKDGNYIIGHTETGCGPACGGFVKFYNYKAGKWTEITSTVFPEVSEMQIKKAFEAKNLDTEENGTNAYFLLPRQGTTVTLACNMCNDGAEDFVLEKFAWNGVKFNLVR